MTDSAYPVQLGVVASLLGSSAVTALVGQRIFDPLSAANQPYPLIEVGDDQIFTNPDGITDMVLCTVHVWADGVGGRLVAKTIADAVRSILAPRWVLGSTTLAVTNFSVLSCVHHMSRYTVEDDPDDPNGTVAHGNLQFKLQLAPTA